MIFFLHKHIIIHNLPRTPANAFSDNFRHTFGNDSLKCSKFACERFGISVSTELCVLLQSSVELTGFRLYNNMISWLVFIYEKKNISRLWSDKSQS